MYFLNGILNRKRTAKINRINRINRRNRRNRRYTLRKGRGRAKKTEKQKHDDAKERVKKDGLTKKNEELNIEKIRNEKKEIKELLDLFSYKQPPNEERTLKRKKTAKKSYAKLDSRLSETNKKIKNAKQRMDRNSGIVKTLAPLIKRL